MTRSLSRLAWSAYDHLGSLVALNLLWSVLVLPWLGAAAALVWWGLERGPAIAFGATAAGIELVALSPPTLLLFVAASRWQAGLPLQRKTVLAAWRELALRVQVLGLAAAMLSVLFTANILFYQHFFGSVGVAASFAFVWLQIYQLLLLPVLPAALTREPSGLVAALRLSLVLTVKRPGTTVVLGLASAVLLALALLSGVGLVAGCVSLWALLVTQQLEALLAHASGRPLEPAPRRSWRELLRPWDME